jgi:hypothetical protein
MITAARKGCETNLSRILRIASLFWSVANGLLQFEKLLTRHQWNSCDGVEPIRSGSFGG